MNIPVRPQADVSGAIRAALARREPPHDAGPAANVLTFGWRALLKIKHMPEQLFDVVVTPIMFTVLFTYMFGGALAGSPREYLQFLLPGILVQTIVFTSIYTGLTLNTDISKGVFDRFRSMPIWQLSPIVGAMAGDTIRYAISSAIVVFVGVVIGYRPETGVLGVLLSVLLLIVFALGLSWVFIIAGLLVRSPGTMMTLSWLVLMPLTFASNIYVDPATMPGWLQAIVAANPVAILVDAVRAIVDGAAGPRHVGLSLMAPALITLVCAPIALWLYRRER
jgi:ABC-2 type transport system permease protein